MPKVPLTGYSSKVSKYDKEEQKDYDYMNSFKQQYMPIMPLPSTGNSLFIKNYKSGTITTGNNPICLFIVPSCRGTVQAIAWDMVTGVYVANSVQNLSPTWKYGTEDAPEYHGNVRCCAKIQNITSNDKKAGVVRVLQTSNPLEFEFVLATPIYLTTASAGTILEGIRNNPRSRTYGADFFSDSADKTIIGGISSMINYSAWGKAFNNGTTDGDISSMLLESQKSDNNFHMNNICILFEPTGADANTYEISITNDSKNRYHNSTLLSTLQKPIKSDVTGRHAIKLDVQNRNNNGVHVDPQPGTGVPMVPAPTRAEIRAQAAEARAKAQPKPKGRPKKKAQPPASTRH